jgi:hypothetical protein
MEHMPKFPYVTLVALGVVGYGHSFGSSLFAVLRRCTGVKELDLDFLPEIQLEVILLFILLSNTQRSRMTECACMHFYIYVLNNVLCISSFWRHT